MNEGQKKRTGDVMHAAGLAARIAVNSYGEPVCIGSAAMTDDSIGLTLYMNGDTIVGVEVVDPTMMRDPKDGRLMVTRVGLVPTTEYDDRFMDTDRRTV